MTLIPDYKVNIAFSGGPCTGKSTTSAMLFSELKQKGYDYDLIFEEYRKLKSELGSLRSPFERFYMWRQQEREEIRSTAQNGFITDSPLFNYYIQANLYKNEPRDMLAVRELLRMCFEIEPRYRLIVIAKNIDEIPYKNDQSRIANAESAEKKHLLTISFVQHFWKNKLFFVSGSTAERVQQIIAKLESMHSLEDEDRKKKKV